MGCASVAFPEWPERPNRIRLHEPLGVVSRRIMVRWPRVPSLRNLRCRQGGNEDDPLAARGFAMYPESLDSLAEPFMRRGLPGWRWHRQRSASSHIDPLLMGTGEEDDGAILRPVEVRAQPDAALALLSELSQARTICMDEPNL